MTPTPAAMAAAFSIWHIMRAVNTRRAWGWAHDYMIGAATYASALGNYADHDYFNELATAASEIAAECR